MPPILHKNLTQMKDKEQVIANIKQALKSKNMTQRELAAQLNKNEAEISRWFCLKNGIGKTNLIRINEILGIDAEKGTQKYQQKKSIKSTKNKNNMNYAIILAHLKLFLL